MRRNNTVGWQKSSARMKWHRNICPTIAYLSVTQPGVGQGPHAHRDQTDLFCFPGPGEFRWSLGCQVRQPGLRPRQDFRLGAYCPASLIIPRGGTRLPESQSHPGPVCNFANRLYRGPGAWRRWTRSGCEDDADSPFRLDEVWGGKERATSHERYETGAPRQLGQALMREAANRAGRRRPPSGPDGHHRPPVGVADLSRHRAAEWW